MRIVPGGVATFYLPGDRWEPTRDSRQPAGIVTGRLVDMEGDMGPAARFEGFAPRMLELTPRGRYDASAWRRG
jgi:hypothetical protein